MKCQGCGHDSAYEQMEEDYLHYGENGLVLSGFKVPVIRCGSCHLAYTDWRAEGIRHNVVCDYLNVLRPNDIRAIRDNLTRREFADILGVTEKNIEDVETSLVMISPDLSRKIFEYGSKEASVYRR